ncbi:MAG: hypothetical protein KJN64_02010 [Ignavibacteria bacterium]|nr:hypothetical protein [Ignavibacteria bacterium]MBT8383326.1 hypothetical protein [Ignavibacteria bacterium]MBT8391398.1 hypothetical protein [Ignavibacteria bacterium]NNJ52424.1 hypothetical protein [Ignavibacteriaceae bacterium]NNL19836.1 hypothetical protein [Ignavibacteriaceae bacterium]
MQHRKQFFFIIIILVAALLISCEVNQDDKEICEQSKWDEIKEPTIILRVTQPDDYCTGNTHKVDSAEYLKFTGSIQKYYCDDTPSGLFDYSKTISPVAGTNYVHVGAQYRYKFANDKDRLLFKCKLKAYFNDGNIYETLVVERLFYYNDIKFDANTFEQYILLVIPDLNWYSSS